MGVPVVGKSGFGFCSLATGSLRAYCLRVSIIHASGCITFSFLSRLMHKQLPDPYK